MPEFLKEFLEKLTKEQAQAVWDWADESDAAEDIIEIVYPLSKERE